MREIMNTKRMPVRHGKVKIQSGFTMIEMLVAVLIVSIGLLGVAGLQVYGLSTNHSAYLRSQATFLAYDITDRMRANDTAARAGSYNIAYADAAPSGGDVAATDLQQWLAALNQALPEGDGAINVQPTGAVTVQVRWLDDKENGDTVEFVLETQL